MAEKLAVQSEILEYPSVYSLVYAMPWVVRSLA